MKKAHMRKVRLMPIFITVSVFILMFQLNISEYIPSINYYDELLAIGLFTLFFLRCKGKFKLIDVKIIVSLLLVILIGCLGNNLSHINKNAFIMLVDSLGIIKVFLTLIAVKGILNERECDSVIEMLAISFQFYVFTAAICYLLATVLHWSWMFKQTRFGFGTYGFIHGYAGDGWLGYYLEACYCIFEMAGDNIKIPKITKCVCLALCVLTLKGPALLFVAFVVLFNFVVKKKKLKIWHIMIAILVGTVIGWWYIQRYLLTPGEARAYLNLTGLKIALDNFPIGLGMATFGSDLSRDNYSTAYSMYNLNNVYGLGGSGSLSYITDTYWGMLLGQVGILGTLFVAYVLYRIFGLINFKNNMNGPAKCATLAMFFSFMAGSLGSAYLTSHLGVMCFAILGLYANPKCHG